MKNFLLLLLLCGICGGAMKNTGGIILKVSGVKNKSGKMYIILHNNAESFVTKKRMFKGIVLDLGTQKTEYLFTDIPAGKYAISVFHDENSDGKLNTNAIGVPKEGFGFSNNVVGPMSSKPSFTDAVFDVIPNKNRMMEIKIKYPKQ